MKKNLWKYGIFTFMLLTSFVVFAQSGPGDDDDNSNLENDDDPPVPINGKLIWLAILGIIFAWYTYKSFRKQAES
jgi:hypothetical protein